MPSDSRIEKLAAHYAEDRNVQLIRLQPGDLTETAENVLNHCEAAGLILADPADEATRATLRKALEHAFWPFLAHDPHKPEVFWPQAVDSVLAALAVKP